MHASGSVDARVLRDREPPTIVVVGCVPSTKSAAVFVEPLLISATKSQQET
jgi:hypothetical protein